MFRQPLLYDDTYAVVARAPMLAAQLDQLRGRPDHALEILAAVKPLLRSGLGLPAPECESDLWDALG